jgi:hypothetical protein
MAIQQASAPDDDRGMETHRFSAGPRDRWGEREAPLSVCALRIAERRASTTDYSLQEMFLMDDEQDAGKTDETCRLEADKSSLNELLNFRDDVGRNRNSNDNRR